MLSVPLSGPALAFPPRFGWADSRAPLLPPSLLRGPLCVALGLSLSRLPFALPPAFARVLARRLVVAVLFGRRLGRSWVFPPAVAPFPPVARSARCPRSLALAPGFSASLATVCAPFAVGVWPVGSPVFRSAGGVACRLPGLSLGGGVACRLPGLSLGGVQPHAKPRSSLPNFFSAFGLFQSGGSGFLESTMGIFLP